MKSQLIYGLSIAEDSKHVQMVKLFDKEQVKDRRLVIVNVPPVIY